MAFTKNYMNEMFGTVLVLSALLSTASAVDCHGKSFHCVNSTHFMICVDLGGGVSQAIENFFIACPPPTTCQGNNHFECEFPAPTTPSTTLSNVISETTLPWEEVVTTSPGNTTKVLAENYMNTERITTTPDYIINTDATGDSTATTVSNLSTNNDLNITEIVPTSATDTVTSATETTTEITNKNLNITDIVPDVVNDLTTTAVEIAIQTTTERITLPETKTESIVEEITTTNIDISAQTITENTVITSTTLATDSGYVAPTTTENVTDIVTVQLHTELPQLAILSQNKSIKNNILSKEPSFENTYGATEKPVTNIPHNITAVHTDAPTNEIIQNVLSVESTSTVEIFVETTTGSIEHSTIDVYNKTGSMNKSESLNLIEVVESGVAKDQTIVTAVEGSDKSGKKQATNGEENKAPHLPTIDNVNQFTTILTDNQINDVTTTVDELITQLSKNNSTPYDYLEVPFSTEVPILYENNVKENVSYVSLDKNNLTLNQVTFIKTLENSVNTEQVTTTNEERLTTDTTFNFATQSITVPTNQAINQDITTTEATYTPSTISNAQPIPPATQDKLITESPLPAKGNNTSINNEKEYGASTEQPTTNTGNLITDTTLHFSTERNIVPANLAGNLNIVSTEATQTPTTNNIAQQRHNSTPYDYLEVTVSTEVPLLYENNAKENVSYVSIDKNNMTLNQVTLIKTLENGVNTEQVTTTNEEILTTDTTLNFATESITVPTNQAINQDITTTDATNTPSTISNVQPIPPATQDKLIIESPLPAKGNNTTINNEIESRASTEQPPTTNKDNLITDTTLYLSTERNIAPANLAGNLNIVSTEASQTPTTNNIAQQRHNSTPYDYLEVSVSAEVPLLFENNVKENISYVSIDKNNMTLNQVTLIKTLENGVNTEQVTTTNEERLTTDTTLNFATESITVPTNQAINQDITTTDATYTPSTISNVQPIPPATQDKLIIESPLPAKGNTIINNEEEYGASTEQPTTTNKDNLITVPTNLAGNLNIVATEATQKPTTNNIAQPIPSTSENNLMTEASNGLYIPTTGNNNNVQPLVSAFEDQTTTEAPLPTDKNFTATIDNNGSAAKGLIAEQSANLEFITTETMYITTAMDSVQQMPPASTDNAMTESPLLTTKNIVSTLSSESSTNSLMVTKPNNFFSDAGHETAVLFMRSTSVLPLKKAIDLEKQIMGTVHEDTITTESTISVSGISTAEGKPISEITKNNLSVVPGKQTGINKKTNSITAEINVKTPSTTISNNDEIFFYVLPTVVDDTKNVLLLSTRDKNKNENVILSTKNTILVNGKPASESVSEPSSFYNAESLDTKVSPKFVYDNESNTTTRKYTAQYNEVTTSTIGSNGLKDEINWNPLANYLINKDPETVKKLSVTNASVTEIDRNTSRLDIHFISQQTTNQTSIGDPNLNHSFAMNGFLDNITQVYREPKTEPLEILVVKDSINFNIDKLAPTVGKDVTSTATTMHKNQNTYETPYDLSSPPGSIFDTTDNTLRPFAGTQDPSIVSLSKISDRKPDKKPTSTAKNYGDVDSPTVHRNLPGQFVINTFEINTHAFSEATEVGTTTKRSKVREEADISSNPVMLDILPLPVNNIKWSLPVTNSPYLTDLTSSTDDSITIVTTESYRPLTLDPIFADSRIQARANVGDTTTVPKNGDFGFYTQKGVPTVGNSNSNSQTRVYAESNSAIATYRDASLNAKKGFNDRVDISLQYPQQGEIVLNKIVSAPNNTNILSEIKPSVSETNTAAAHNIFNTTSFDNAPKRISQESLFNYESRNSEKTPQNFTFSTESRKNNTTDVTNLQIAPQNTTTRNGDTQSAQQNKFSANITSPKLTQATQLHVTTNRTPSQPVITNPISELNNNLSKQVRHDAAQSYKCINRIRGRYSDKDDCRKFYICLGNSQPIVGNCPENTVFSDLKKLCTKNMSHCVRENEFKCPSVGRFSDLVKTNIYYICVNHKNNLYRFKFLCQKGYNLNKTTLHCIKTNEIESNESVSISSADNSDQTGSISTISSKGSKTISNNTNTSSRANESNSKSENSSKTKKNNEAEETPEQSEDEDDVFRCKKEGKFPIRNECRRYYLCKKNRKSEYRRKIKKCDSDQVFHKNKNRCVDAESYEC